MNFSNRTLLTAAVSAALAFSSVLHAADTKSSGSGSMFAEQKSITKQGTGLNPKNLQTHLYKGMNVVEQSDGSLLIQGKVHGGAGERLNIKIPKVTPNIRMTGPNGGTDENGNELTWRQRVDREITHRAIFGALKGLGYSYEKQKKLLESSGRKTQVEEWREKTEETRRQIAENGPITSKEFLIPGLTPEMSKLLQSKDVGVRIENGKQVYYLNGERLDLKRVEKQKYAAKAEPATKVETHAVRSKRIGFAEEDPKGTSAESKQNSDKDVSKDKNKQQAKAGINKKIRQNQERKRNSAENHNGTPAAQDSELKFELRDDIQRTPPTRKYEPTLEEDYRRDPVPRNLDPSTLPSNDEIQKDAERHIEELFPDLGKLLHSSSAVPIFDRALRVLFGVREAQAAQTPEELPLDCNGCKRGFDIKPEELGIQMPDSSLTDQFRDIVGEIKTGHERMTEDFKKKSAEMAKKETLTADDIGLGVPSYLDAVKGAGELYDPAQFAAEVVNRSKSLTPDQFAEDALAVVAPLSDKKSPANILNALEAILDANPEIRNVIPDADERLAELRGGDEERGGSSDIGSKGETTYIFVSYSLTDDLIKEIIKRHAKRKDVVLVMRGVPEGATIQDGMMRMQSLAGEIDPPASVIIDPPLFKAYGITQVPSVVRTGKPLPEKVIDPLAAQGRKFPEMVAKVTGLHNDKWLMERIELGERGDLGIQGETREISEPDLIEVMKERVAQIDWAKKKHDAAEQYWTKQEYTVYPTAEEERLREIDPTILVERDLLDLAGRPIRKAGDRINPLEIRPFTQTMVIFNPLSEDEMDRVLRFQEDFSRQARTGLVLIATQNARDDGWQKYKDLTDRLDSHVFMMVPEVARTWQVEKTPTVVTADNYRHVFLVKELGPLAEKEEK